MKEEIRNLLHDLLTDISKGDTLDRFFIDKWEAEILSLFPGLDNLEVVEECKECFKGVVRLSEKTIGDCTSCQGTGKVTRAATWEECIEALKDILSDTSLVSIEVTGGGMLRVKGE